MNVIEFKNVTKAFHRVLGQRLIRHYLEDLLGKTDPDSFQALKNLNFVIKDGESVAVIGANGAGKSTLLSLVTRLVPPSSGEVIINGRIAALLEVVFARAFERFSRRPSASEDGAQLVRTGGALARWISFPRTGSACRWS